jgi:hypothetical protein
MRVVARTTRCWFPGGAPRGRASEVRSAVAVGGGRTALARSSLGAVSDARGGVMSELPLDAAGRRRSRATLLEFHAGRPRRNKGIRYPADPPTIEEIIAVMRHAGDGIHGRLLRGLSVVLWTRPAAHPRGTRARRGGPRPAPRLAAVVHRQRPHARTAVDRGGGPRGAAAHRPREPVLAGPRPLRQLGQRQASGTLGLALRVFLRRSRLELEADEPLVADHPRVVAGLDDVRLPRTDLDLGAVLAPSGLALQALLERRASSGTRSLSSYGRGLELALDLELARVHRGAAAGCL